MDADREPTDTFNVLLHKSSGKSNTLKYFAFGGVLLVLCLGVIGSIIYFSAMEPSEGPQWTFEKPFSFPYIGVKPRLVNGDYVLALLGGVSENGSSVTSLELLGDDMDVSDCPTLPSDIYDKDESDDGKLRSHFSGIGLNSDILGACEQGLSEDKSHCALYNPYQRRWDPVGPSEDGSQPTLSAYSHPVTLGDRLLLTAIGGNLVSLDLTGRVRKAGLKLVQKDFEMAQGSCGVAISEQEVVFTGGHVFDRDTNMFAAVEKDVFIVHTEGNGLVQSDRQLPSLGSWRSFHGCGTALLRGELILIVAGGIDANENVIGSVQSINVLSEEPSWQPMGSLRAARHNYPTVGVLGGGRLVVAGGEPAVKRAMAMTEVFNSETWDWEESEELRLQVPRSGHSTGVLQRSKCFRTSKKKKRERENSKKTIFRSKSPFDRQYDDDVNFS